MKLDGLHLLLTYQCTFECDHCFAWGSPWQTGTMTLDTIRNILLQATETGFVEWIYFEGGEPFLYYQTMIAGIYEANKLGFKVGIVTNGYWATSDEDAFLCISPLVDKVHDLTISSDLFHYADKVSQQSQRIRRVTEKLGIPLGVICIEQPEIKALSTIGQIPSEPSNIMYRGRAVEKLANKVSTKRVEGFTECPHEDLVNPGRVHIDPFGNMHICQGISIGNIFASSIKDICNHYNPEKHPIISPLLRGGPLNLAEEYHIPYRNGYADACHMCFETRVLLRKQFSGFLLPDQMYSVSS